ncbi:uncharacterized protein JN550_000439 [Neoarthrinium moseri]|uniref:uncharacterized protein n=1 Tax=Neoarthrinium moseri TaxID=1658444 RepID=UPI001FDE2637|nr:uncharacterized protein JN550_000439 [Neoarthrinium moseri]KAI1878257.1 hypothetical protein JN550_000439 [Neoarthrinium moseri]
MAFTYLTFATAAFAILSVLLIAARIQDYVSLKHIPGPSAARWTDLWMIRAQLSGRMQLILREQDLRYGGKLLRIAPKWVVCNDPAEIRKIWGVRTQWQRPDWYRGLRVDPYRDNSFSTIDDQRHETLRSKIAPGYAGKDVDKLQELVDEQVAELINLLESRYLSSKEEFKPVDFASKVPFFTLDVISSLAFGKPFGHLKADADIFRWLEMVEKTVPFMLTVALMPWVLDILQSKRMRSFLPDARNIQGIGTVMHIGHSVVAERYQAHAPVQRDMIGSFIAHGLSQEDCEGESLVQILAGSDTSATAIRSTILFLMTNPLAYHRFQEEIDEAVANGKISSPITNAEAQNFAYLQAVIREGLRLWPPASGLLPKMSKKDEVVCGVSIPAGTHVAWNPWSVMRDREVFGQDAELFRPERWLDAPEEQGRLMDLTIMMAFKGGSKWECLGKNIAFLELNKIYVELLRRFDFTLIDPTNPWKVWNAAVSIQTDMFVKITRRAARS